MAYKRLPAGDSASEHARDSDHARDSASGPAVATTSAGKTGGTSGAGTSGADAGAGRPAAGGQDDTVLLRVRRGTRPQAPPDPEHASTEHASTEHGVPVGNAAAEPRGSSPARADAPAKPSTSRTSPTGGRVAVARVEDGLDVLDNDDNDRASTEGHRTASTSPASHGEVSHAAVPAGPPSTGPLSTGSPSTGPLSTGPLSTRPAGAARRRWARLVVLLLLAALGFATSVSVRSNSGSAGLATARQEDLVRTLDTLDSEEDRLTGELEDLERTRDELAGGGGPAAALEEARDRAEGLAILAGTAPAAGPGIEMVVSDSGLRVDAGVIVDALQELRDAGAEAIQIGDVRVVASTFVLDNPAGGIFVEQTPMLPPYRLLVIGDGHTLAQAMQIPGGVLDKVASREGAVATVEVRERIEISALRPLPTPRYARPAG